MKEFETCSTNDQLIFNSMLCSARNQIQCAFRRLKARWLFLSLNVDFKLQHMPTVVYSCFILHNYCEYKQQIMRHRDEEENTPNVPYSVYYTIFVKELLSITLTLKCT